MRYGAPIAAAAVALCLAVAPAWAATVDDGWTAFDDGDYARSFKIWSQLAETGDAEAEYLVGYLYDDGSASATTSPPRRAGTAWRPSRATPMPSSIWR